MPAWRWSSNMFRRQRFFEEFEQRSTKTEAGTVVKTPGNKIINLQNIFRIVVDYSKSLAEMIRAGNYNDVDDDITGSHFPVKGQGNVELEVEIVHYDKSMTSEDIVRDMESRGLRSATLPELLAFGAFFPDKQREFLIMALGSVWRERNVIRFVACLDSGSSERKLTLAIWSGYWDKYYHFLAVRK